MNQVLRRFLCLTSASVLLTLAACASNAPAPEPKLPQVRTQTQSHPVVFADGVTYINPLEQNALDDFVRATSTGASSATLAVDDNNLRAVARARSVRNYLVAKGFNKNVIRLAPTPGADPRTVVLTLEFVKVIPPQNCPDWSRGAASNFQNTDSADFGCSYYNDMIVQMADPADYVSGHGTPAISGARDSMGIQKYTAAVPLSSSGGSSSASSGASSGGGAGTSGTSP